MFMYLNMCPVTLISGYPMSSNEQHWFKSWFIFYQDLFKTKSLSHIILTLNRMMKNYSPIDKDGNIRNQKLFVKIKNLHLHRHKNMKSILPGETINASVIQNVEALKRVDIIILDLKFNVNLWCQIKSMNE